MATKEADLVEKLANVEHDRWSHWMKYLFTKGTDNADGSFTIDAGSVAHWRRQMKTSYWDLTDKEQESDRVEVRKTLKVLTQTLEDLGSK